MTVLAALVCGAAQAQEPIELKMDEPPVSKKQVASFGREEVEFPAVYKNSLNGKTFSEKIIFNAVNGDYTLLDWKAAEKLGLGSDNGITFTPKSTSGLTSTTRRIKRKDYLTLLLVKFFPASQLTGIDEDAPEIEFVAVTSKRGFPITGTDSSGRKITIKIKTLWIEKRRGFASQHSIIGGDWADHADLVFYSRGRLLYWQATRRGMGFK